MWLVLKFKQFGMTARELTDEFGMLPFLLGKFALQASIGSAKVRNFRLSILERDLRLLAFLIAGCQKLF